MRTHLAKRTYHADTFGRPYDQEVMQALGGLADLRGDCSDATRDAVLSEVQEIQDQLDLGTLGVEREGH